MPLVIVEKTIPWVSPVPAAMSQFQLICGMRPSEVCRFDGDDILDRSAYVWIYQPTAHKNAWRDASRMIAIPPVGQAIVEPFLRLHPHGYVFRPIDRATASSRIGARFNMGLSEPRRPANRFPNGIPIGCGIRLVRKSHDCSGNKRQNAGWDTSNWRRPTSIRSWNWANCWRLPRTWTSIGSGPSSLARREFCNHPN